MFNLVNIGEWTVGRVLSFGTPEHAHGKLICAVPVACMGKDQLVAKSLPTHPLIFSVKGILACQRVRLELSESQSSREGLAHDL